MHEKNPSNNKIIKNKDQIKQEDMKFKLEQGLFKHNSF